MKIITTNILFIFIILLSVTSCRQTEIKIPADFIETTPPKSGSNEWFTLNYSKKTFGVEIINGKLEISIIELANKCVLKLTDGTLYANDKGEWGGELFFVSKDSVNKGTLIKKGNIKFLFLYKNNIYFIEGLAHLGISEGAFYELDKTNNKFTYRKILDFEDAPEALTICENEFLIATHKNFYRIKDFKKELIFANEFWDGLYPSSIAVQDDKNVFLGIRGGIVKLNLTNKTLKFYKYTK